MKNDPVNWEAVVRALVEECKAIRKWAEINGLTGFGIDKFAKTFESIIEEKIEIHTYKTSPTRRRRVSKRTRTT